MGDPNGQYNYGIIILLENEDLKNYRKNLDLV